MEADWDNLTPAPYYNLFMGFYLVENVHFTGGDNGVPYFAADEDDAFINEDDDFENPDWGMDFWNDIEPPPLANDFMRMRG